MSNPYLARKREQYSSIQATIEGLQTRAADENRDLTEAELRSIQEQGEVAGKIFEEIKALTDLENRSSKVAEMADAVSGATPRTTSNASAVDRDPGHYRSATQGGQYSFFGDLYSARALHDEDAQRRLVEHTRALDTSGAGSGIVPPKWLIEEYAEMARQGRALADAVRNIPLGSDPRPFALPRQSGMAETDEQESENDSVHDNDGFNTTTGTVTPVPQAGKQEVSRQLLESSNPAVDQLIFGDLIGDLNEKIEAKVGALVLATGQSAITAVESDFSDYNSADFAPKLAVRAALAVRKGRKRPANILACTVDRYGEILNLQDAAGRPLVPEESAGPMNVVGVGSVAVDGRLRGLGIVATDGMDAGVPGEDIFAAVRASDILLFESDLLRFRFEEQKGPETVVLGVWKYIAAVARYTAAVQRVLVTEDESSES